ncbi:hypothetical protein ACFL6I_27610, partial [candidate division KSB1 bacterium]
GVYQHKCKPNDAINFIELVSTDKEDKRSIKYLKEQISKIQGSNGKPYFKGAMPGKYNKEYALPYIYMFRNHSRKMD